MASPQHLRVALQGLLTRVRQWTGPAREVVSSTDLPHVGKVELLVYVIFAFLSGAALFGGASSLHFFDPVRQDYSQGAAGSYSNFDAHGLANIHRTDIEKLGRQYAETNSLASGLRGDVFLASFALDKGPLRDSLIYKTGGPIWLATNVFGGWNSDWGLEDTIRLRDKIDELRLAVKRRQILGRALHVRSGIRPIPCLVSEVRDPNSSDPLVVFIESVPKRYLAHVPETPEKRVTEAEFLRLREETVQRNIEIEQLYTAYRRACVSEGPYKISEQVIDVLTSGKLALVNKNDRNWLREIDREIPGENGAIEEIANQSGCTDPLETERSPIIDYGQILTRVTRFLCGAKVESAISYVTSQNKWSKYVNARRKYESAFSAEAQASEPNLQLQQLAKDLQTKLHLAANPGETSGQLQSGLERIEAIEHLIKSIITYELPVRTIAATVVPELQRSILIAGTVASLARVLERSDDSAQVLQLIALQTRLRIERAQVSFFRGVLEADQDEIDLRFDQIIDLGNSLALLRRGAGQLCIFAEGARRQLEGASEAQIVAWFSEIPPYPCDTDPISKNWPGPGDDPLLSIGLDSFDKDSNSHLVLCPAVQRQFYHALGTLTLFINHISTRSNEIELRLAQIKREKSTLRSIALVSMRDALLRDPLTQIAAYHGSGIRPEAMSQLFAIGIQSLGGTVAPVP